MMMWTMCFWGVCQVWAPSFVDGCVGWWKLYVVGDVTMFFFWSRGMERILRFSFINSVCVWHLHQSWWFHSWWNMIPQTTTAQVHSIAIGYIYIYMSWINLYHKYVLIFHLVGFSVFATGVFLVVPWPIATACRECLPTFAIETNQI